uniref:hypothetical protein n=1 Tax=Cylindrospermopsis raciborskii TaxID=77022 RepID=UPI000E1F937A|nr:hypothetical protein [Cylindrospermopsis raciborskii]
MSTYIIGIGGTGAKSIEAIIQLTSIGLFGEESLKLLFVDTDETNGNVNRALESLDIYNKCYELGLQGKHPWMKTAIQSLPVWSPFADNDNVTNKNLAVIFKYNLIKENDAPLGNLFDVLYTSKEREASLDVGFRGRPSIGAAVMSQVRMDTADNGFWGNLMGQIQRDAGGGRRPKIFLCGSIFGGTGASGLPTIGRLIHNRLETLKIRDNVDLGCLFVLPYFSFTPEENPEEVYARSEQFLLNTEAALRYYGGQPQETFDVVYLLGNQQLSPVRKFSIGKNTQCNDPHFIELYAALAGREFLLNPLTGEKKVVLMNRENPKILNWGDIPDDEKVRAEMLKATRFAFAWLSNIAPELKKAKDLGEKEFRHRAGTSWFVKFFPAPRGILGGGNKSNVDFNDAEQQRAIEKITAWCKDYLRWLGHIHESPGETIQLFHGDHLRNLNDYNLANLIFAQADPRDRNKKSEDTIQKLKESLKPEKIDPPNLGTIGLAKSLYHVC